MHQSIGHLGIFVSGKVATKEHGEFATCMEMIDLMPPGLYEAVITEVDEDTAQSRAGPRQIPVPAGGAHARRHPRARRQRRRGRPRFATAARVSEINLGLYRTMLAPAVRGDGDRAIGRGDARARIPTGCASPRSPIDNPMMQPVKALAESVRAARKPVSADNPLLAMEQIASRPGSRRAWRRTASSATR